MTMYDTRTNLSREVVEEVRKHFPDRVFDTIIPRNVRLSEAPSHGETILSYAPQTTGGEAYRTLAQELVMGDEELGSFKTNDLPEFLLSRVQQDVKRQT